MLLYYKKNELYTTSNIISKYNNINFSIFKFIKLYLIVKVFIIF